MTGRAWRAAIAVVAAAALAPGCRRSPDAQAKPVIKVAAAADLGTAFQEVGQAYEKKTGQRVTFSFGSTGLLAKQIAEGAPFDLFAAANTSFVDDVVKAGACEGDSRALYARGRIVAWTKRDAPLAPASLEDLKDPRYAKVSIANPEHAPYGKAARQALVKAGVWDDVSKKAVYGENVQQALQFAQSGNAEVAIVALSLAISSGGRYLAIDPATHEPLDQALVVCKGTAPAADARAFAAYVGSDEGRALMKRYGFLLPGESLTDARPR